MYWWISAASARADARSWPNGFSTTTRASVGQPGVGKALDRPCRTGTAGSPGRRPGVRASPIAVGHAARTSRRRRSRRRRRRAAPRSGRTPRRRASRRCRDRTRARARAARSTVQSSTATPTIGQSSRPRRSSRYSDRNVITFARSPVIPKMTSTSAGCGSSVVVRAAAVRAWGLAAVVIGPPLAPSSSSQRCFRAPPGWSSPDASETPRPPGFTRSGGCAGTATPRLSGDGTSAPCGDEPDGERFMMREKLMSIGDDFWIENGRRRAGLQGRRQGAAHPATLRARGRRRQRGGQDPGEKLQRPGQDADRREATPGDRAQGPVGIRDRFEIDVDHGADMKAHGNFVDHEYEIERDGDTVATISKNGSGCATPTASRSRAGENVR